MENGIHYSLMRVQHPPPPAGSRHPAIRTISIISYSVLLAVDIDMSRHVACCKLTREPRGSLVVPAYSRRKVLPKTEPMSLRWQGEMSFRWHVARGKRHVAVARRQRRARRRQSAASTRAARSPRGTLVLPHFPLLTETQFRSNKKFPLPRRACYAEHAGRRAAGATGPGDAGGGRGVAGGPGARGSWKPRGSQGSPSPGAAPVRPLPSARPRRKRAPHSLLGPFDFSKLFKKKKPKPAPAPAPAPALRAAASSDNSTRTALPLNSLASNSTALSLLSIPADDSAFRTSEAPESILWLHSATSPSFPPEGRTRLLTPAERTTAGASAVNLNISLGLDKIDDRIVSQTTVETPKQKTTIRQRATDQRVGRRAAGGQRSRCGGGGGAAADAGASKKKEEPPPWPLKHAAVVEGDIILGGLMMVHGRSEGATCGPVMSQGGVQALEAMLFALDHARAPPRAPGLRRSAPLVLTTRHNDT
ncbi:hypothetical protein MSG28_010013 [Choristoneura fumiferana]|uniref:Uncharacterized protein n=1 Tax=Choristoneura fumiferana TaxID=7141 RepID=A0ACC0KIT6_CHOFU|nr:hypothetical protein MSG28_010013 [Choristoneura fumiferana]